MWRGISFLLYKQNGGSGFNLLLPHILDLDFDRFEYLIDRLNELRAADEAALRKASRRRKK